MLLSVRGSPQQRWILCGVAADSAEDSIRSRRGVKSPKTIGACAARSAEWARHNGTNVSRLP
jgi:hypothetical protein